MAKILKGAEVVSALHARLIPQVEELKSRGVQPTLGIVRVGERADDVAYEKGATKRAETLGVSVQKFVLPADAWRAALSPAAEAHQ